MNWPIFRYMSNFFWFNLLHLKFLLSKSFALHLCLPFPSVFLFSTFPVAQLFQDQTLCSRVKCPFYGTCRLKEDGKPFCACAMSCRDSYKPVCGSDGNSYLTECFLRRKACLMRKHITVQYSGHCSKLVALFQSLI